MLHSRSSLHSDDPTKYSNHGEKKIRETARDHEIPTNIHSTFHRTELILIFLSLCFFPHTVATELRTGMPRSTRSARRRSSRRLGRSPCKFIFNFALLRSYIVSSGSSQSCGSAPETCRNECAALLSFHQFGRSSATVTGFVNIFHLLC